jgi:hypothetical protein
MATGMARRSVWFSVLVLAIPACSGEILGIAGSDPQTSSGGADAGSGGSHASGSGGKGTGGAASGGADGGALGGAASVCEDYAARCDGRACGNDGFDGSCGACPAGQRCSLDGQCVACTPDCDGKECGDDGCGDTCGTCAGDKTCSLGKCTIGVPQDKDELEAIYYINQFRNGPGPIPKSCNHDGDSEVFPDPGPVPPSRLNADMVENTRHFAQNVVDWVTDTGQGFCGHQDPVDPDATYRKGTYFGEIGLQNCWCGYVDPASAPITGDPWHCGNMEARDANEWGLGHVRAANGNGYQVQDIGTDHAYMTVVMNDEALTTPTPNVKVYVLGEGIFGGPDPVESSRPFRFMGKVKEVELSENSCFVGASWQPYAPLIDYQLSSGDGRKVLYARLKDENGHTFVTWDSIYVGAEPAAPNTYEEAIRRIRSVRMPALAKDGYDSFAYSLGQYREAEDTGVWWGYREAVDDPDASGGKALSLFQAGQEGGLARIWTGPNNAVPVGEGEIWFRAKVSDNSGAGSVFNFSWREDSGAPPGQAHDVKANEFSAPNQYQWFRLPFVRTFETSLFYVEFSAAESVLVDRFEIWSKPRPLADTQSGAGLTLDFDQVNYRGMEIGTRFLNSQTGAWEEGPRINPYCSLCGG